jgi:hypothetical protein
MLNQKDISMDSSSVDLFSFKLTDDKESQQKKLIKRRNALIRGFITLIPFSLFSSMSETHSPILIIDVLCLLRLLKIWPIFKLLGQFK